MSTGRAQALSAPRASSGALDALAARVRPVSLARDQQLPVLPALAPLVPGGALRRGTTVAVSPAVEGPARPGPRSAPGAGPASGVGPVTGMGSASPVGSAPGAGSVPGVGHAGGATALALALAAGASQAGSWVAAVGLGSLGLVAAADYGVAPQRLALVDTPEPGVWAAIVAALVDGFDIVLVAAGPQVRRRPADARRLAARVRERGAVLVAVGGDLPERSRLQLAVSGGAWEGLDAEGYGRLARRRVTVAAGGRGEASQPRRAELWLPAADGTVAPVEEMAPAVPLTPRRPGRSAPASAVPASAAGRSGSASLALASAASPSPVPGRDLEPAAPLGRFAPASAVPASAAAGADPEPVAAPASGVPGPAPSGRPASSGSAAPARRRSPASLRPSRTLAGAPAHVGASAGAAS